MVVLAVSYVMSELRSQLWRVFTLFKITLGEDELNTGLKDDPCWL